MKRRSATISCPDSITPRMRRFLTLALMAVASDFGVSSGISSLFVICICLRAIKRDFAFRRPSSTDDSNYIFDSFSPDDKYNTAGDRPDRNETILGLRVLRVVHLEVIHARGEKRCRLIESNSVFGFIRAALFFIPLEVQECGSIKRSRV